MKKRTHAIATLQKEYSDLSTDLQFPEIHLGTIHRGRRTIAYSTAGVVVDTTSSSSDDADTTSTTPVLFFYPAGGNRRMVYSLHPAAVAADLRILCINRPGKGGTSPSPPPRQQQQQQQQQQQPSSLAEAHLTTTIQDAVHVLDQLGIQRVSLLCMCAGTPFALAFATMHPERTNGLLLGISSWVLPADCGRSNTTWLHSLGTCLPKRLVVAPLVQSVFCSIQSSVTTSLLPTSWVIRGMKQKLSKQEQEMYDLKFRNKEEFARNLSWLCEERGGEGCDVAVLLSKGEALGLDYRRIGETQRVVLWHSEKDAMVPFGGANWLGHQIPSAQLHLIPGGSHEGPMLLLYPFIEESLQFLAVDRCDG